MMHAGRGLGSGGLRLRSVVAFGLDLVSWDVALGQEDEDDTNDSPLAESTISRCQSEGDGECGSRIVARLHGGGDDRKRRVRRRGESHGQRVGVKSEREFRGVVVLDRHVDVSYDRSRG